MDYNHIKNFLEKFKTILFKKEEVIKIVAEVITKHLSYPIETKFIKINGSVICIQGSPILKNEILIHKQGILSDLSGMISSQKFTDIR